MPILQIFSSNLDAATGAMEALLQPEVQTRDVGDDELLRTVLDAGRYEFNARTIALDQTYSELLATGKLRLI